jgi:peptidoglycan hydrolase-like protein with peptidoglycan-binding domain
MRPAIASQPLSTPRRVVIALVAVAAVVGGLGAASRGGWTGSSAAAGSPDSHLDAPGSAPAPGASLSLPTPLIPGSGASPAYSGSTLPTTPPAVSAYSAKTTSVAPKAPNLRPSSRAASPLVAPVPPTPTGLPAAIEPMTDYVGQDSCAPAFRPGTAALGRLLVATYPNTTFGGNYTCGTDGSISEHYEGRALDWMDSARNPRQAAQAAAVLKWLLGTDATGNKYAIARRLGIMYVIWNNRIWGTWNATWDPYENCAKTPQAAMDSFCHRNHIHISLSWNGAMGRTSFWAKTLSPPTDHGPCRIAGLSWAPAYGGYNPTGCPDAHGPIGPKRPTALQGALLHFSGVGLKPGSLGPAVAALQQALRVPATSTFDAPTGAAVRAFQRGAGVPVNGPEKPPTWLRLLATYAGPGAAKKPTVTKPATTKLAAATPVRRLHLSFGARGASVLLLQRRLGVPAGGWFGPLTRAAVSRFQRAHHLQITGAVDSRLWTILGLH